MNTTSFLLIRLAVGISFLGHGLVRLPKLAGFSAWMVASFEKTLLPCVLVIPFSYALPVAEFGIGLALLLGLFTREVSLAGGVVMGLLIFGCCMQENWEPIASQLLHVAFLAAVAGNLSLNTFALDTLLRK